MAQQADLHVHVAAASLGGMLERALLGIGVKWRAMKEP